MRIRLREEERIFQGTAAQVVAQMQGTAIFAAHLDLGGYIDWCIANGKRGGVEVNVTGATLDERCASLVEELIRTGFAEKL